MVKILIHIPNNMDMDIEQLYSRIALSIQGQLN